MKHLRKWLYLPGCAGIIIAGFLAASLLDIVISVVYTRFMTSLAFWACYAVMGILTGSIGYVTAMSWAPEKNLFAHRSILLTFIGLALVFLFLLAPLEGGEYAAAFRSYGIGLIGGVLLFWKYKPLN